MAKHRMNILGPTGDVAVEWDEKRAETGDREAIAAVREAERIFEQHRARGATAFRVEAGQPARRLDTFDPMVERIIVIPRVAGG